MALSQADRDALSKYLDELLQRSIHALPRLDNSTLPDRDTVASVMHAVYNVVEDSFSKFAREHHNPRVPLNARLPPEILARIASHAPYGAREMCLYVCSFWRQALLAERSLWTRMSIMYSRDEDGGIESFTNMLSRGLRQVAADKDRDQNKSEPEPAPPDDGTRLDLTTYVVQMAPHAAISSAIHGIMVHLRSLRVCSAQLLQPSWSILLTSPAPNLETLVISHSPVPGGQNARLALLPDNLFGGVAPKLRDLDLTNIGMPDTADSDAVDARSTGALQVLVNVTRLAYTVQSTMYSEVAKAFRACPAVESFRVRADRADLTAPGPTFEMPPSLRTMSIRGHIAPGYQEYLALGLAAAASTTAYYPSRDLSIYIHSPLPGGRDATLSGVPNLTDLSILPMRYREAGMIGASDFVDVVARSGRPPLRLRRPNPNGGARSRSTSTTSSTSTTPSVPATRSSSPNRFSTPRSTSQASSPALSLVPASPRLRFPRASGQSPARSGNTSDSWKTYTVSDSDSDSDDEAVRTKRPYGYGCTHTRGALGVYAREMVHSLELHVDFLVNLRELRIADYILASLSPDVLYPTGKGTEAAVVPFARLRTLEIHFEPGLSEKEDEKRQFGAWWRRMFSGTAGEDEELFIGLGTLPSLPLTAEAAPRANEEETPDITSPPTAEFSATLVDDGLPRPTPELLSEQHAAIQIPQGASPASSSASLSPTQLPNSLHQASVTLLHLDTDADTKQRPCANSAPTRSDLVVGDNALLTTGADTTAQVAPSTPSFAPSTDARLPTAARRRPASRSPILRHRPSLSFPSLRTLRLVSDPLRAKTVLHAEYISSWLPRSVRQVVLVGVEINEEVCRMENVRVRNSPVLENAGRNGQYWPWPDDVGVEIKRWGWEFDLAGAWQI